VTRLALLLCLALTACRPTPEACVDCVLPPGQEPAVVVMLGGRDTLGDGCRLDRARIEGAVVRAFYRCAPGEVALTLHHVGRAPRGASRAGEFALSTDDPRARPTGLFDALRARVQARGATVRWASARRDREHHTVVSARGAWLLALALGVAIAARSAVGRRGAATPRRSVPRRLRGDGRATPLE